jgi:protease PrsW
MNTILICLFFGLAPSLIWLAFFLKKDNHPEPKRMIVKIFLLGVLITLPVFLIEVGARRFISEAWGANSLISIIINGFIGIAFVEEFAKYLVVREKVFRHPAFDEPVDAMIYMIISALGFAALENALIVAPPTELVPIGTTIAQAAIISFFRFIGATFLHALASGIFGYFLAISFFKGAGKTRTIAAGMILATVLHGLFNVFIIKVEESLAITQQNTLIITNSGLFLSSSLAILILLLGMGAFTLYGFKKLKNIKSICKL